MNIAGYIRSFIRRHGGVKAIAVSTLILVSVMVLLTVIADLILFGTVHMMPIYFAALITVLAGPIILYSFVSLISQLDRSEEKLRALSIMDDMTDVYNRRYFLDQASKELAKAQRYGTIFSIVIIDVDNLKQINDRYGYSAGDAVLQSLANTCMNNLRAMDVFARFAGGQFAFLIPEADKIDVIAFAKKVLSAAEGTAAGVDQQEIHFTISIGVKPFDGTTRNLDALLKNANDALREAKRRGRNCIVIYDAEQSTVENPETVSRPGGPG